jgi:hypothetical protein
VRDRKVRMRNNAPVEEEIFSSIGPVKRERCLLEFRHHNPAIFVVLDVVKRVDGCSTPSEVSAQTGKLRQDKDIGFGKPIQEVVVPCVVVHRVGR